MAKQQQLGQDQLCEALKYHFNHEAFRPFQLEAIQATLSGRDSLLILPTGGGKSMTFQVPALAKSNCFTVVVGPLMALAKDQVTVGVQLQWSGCCIWLATQCQASPHCVPLFVLSRWIPVWIWASTRG